MRRSRALSVPPRANSAGFTLVEIVLSLAIIAVLFVGLIGLLPAGLSASRGAVDATVVGTVVEDVQNRLRGEHLLPGPASFSPAYYDEDGVYIPSPDGSVRRFYRADVAISAWQKPPVNTSGLRPITVAISWPVNASGEAPAASNSKVRLSFAVTPLTGPNWTTIDSSYVPKIEF
jgi:uncharacterized protein (TIGR02598 family)